jgi:hypothetical protein
MQYTYSFNQCIASPTFAEKRLNQAREYYDTSMVSRNPCNIYACTCYMDVFMLCCMLVIYTCMQHVFQHAKDIRFIVLHSNTII